MSETTSCPAFARGFHVRVQGILDAGPEAGNEPSGTDSGAVTRVFYAGRMRTLEQIEHRRAWKRQHGDNARRLFDGASYRRMAHTVEAARLKNERLRREAESRRQELERERVWDRVCEDGVALSIAFPRSDLRARRLIAIYRRPDVSEAKRARIRCVLRLRSRRLQDERLRRYAHEDYLSRRLQSGDLDECLSDERFLRKQFPGNARMQKIIDRLFHPSCFDGERMVARGVLAKRLVTA